MPQQTNSWRIPVAMQLVPVFVMFCILPFIKESPRWLASKGRNAEALANLAWVRNRGDDDYRVQGELAEIVAAVEEEQLATQGAVWYKEFSRKGQRKRFFLAIMMFVCQQWSGQNSKQNSGLGRSLDRSLTVGDSSPSGINYYAPDIFSSIGIHGTTSSLLASGVYGVLFFVFSPAIYFDLTNFELGLVKIVATSLFMAFGVERAGRKKYFAFG